MENYKDCPLRCRLCEKEGCEFWNEDECSIKTIARSLEEIVNLTRRG